MQIHGAEVTNISKTLLMLALVCVQKRPDVPHLVLLRTIITVYCILWIIKYHIIKCFWLVVYEKLKYLGGIVISNHFISCGFNVGE